MTYETLYEAYAAACKERDLLQEAYDAMFRDLQKTCKLREMQAMHETKSEWIPVSERLPKYGHNVLFCTTDGTVCEGIKTAGGWNGFRWNVIYQDRVVTHWMAIPEPPKEV